MPFQRNEMFQFILRFHADNYIKIFKKLTIIFTPPLHKKQNNSVI